MYVINICLFHSMEITGMLYILPTVVLQVEAYLYYETINKTILSFLDVIVAHCGFFLNNVLGSCPGYSFFLHDGGNSFKLLLNSVLKSGSSILPSSKRKFLAGHGILSLLSLLLEMLKRQAWVLQS